MDIPIIIGMLLFVIAICCGIPVFRVEKRIVLLHWSYLGIGFVYGLGWIVVYLSTNAGDNSEWLQWILVSQLSYLRHFASAIILIFGLAGGWYTAKIFKTHSKKYKDEGNISSITPKNFLWCAWLLLGIGVVSQWLYTRAYGGYINYLDYSRAIRSGIFAVENSFSFLQPIGSIILISSYLFWGLRREFVSKYYLNVRLGFIVAFLFSLLYLYSLVGRVGFLMYIATFFLAFILEKKASYIKTAVLGIIGGTVALIAAYTISNWLSLQSADDFIYFASRELLFPFTSFHAHQQYAAVAEYRYGLDLLIAPVYLLPSSWWMNWIEDPSVINTIRLEGAAKGEYGITGGIPVDILTLGMMQASYVGVAMLSFVFGVCLRLLQFLVDAVHMTGFKYILESYFSMRFGMVALFYAQPSHVVPALIPFIIFSIILIIVSFFGKFFLVNPPNSVKREKFSWSRHSHMF